MKKILLPIFNFLDRILSVSLGFYFTLWHWLVYVVWNFKTKTYKEIFKAYSYAIKDEPFFDKFQYELNIIIIIIIHIVLFLLIF